MNLYESGEDYLERILILKEKNGSVRSIDIVSDMHFSKPSVSIAMKKLKENGYISIDKNGLISINDSQFEGFVDFICVFSYKDVVVKSAPYRMRVIGQAVNVYSYLDLLKAVNNGQKVVLQNSIHDDFGYDENGKVVYSEIKSTYDCQYYDNTLNGDKAKIKILLNIRNDIYGNGYEINANNVANGIDSNGQLKKDALLLRL